MAAPIRFFADMPLAEGQHAPLDSELAHHARRVLRMAEGDTLALFNGSGYDYIGQLVWVGARDAAVHITSHAPSPGAEARVALQVVQGIPGGDKMDWMIEKAVELGVAAVQPVLMRRGVMRLDAARAARKQAHWQALAVAASQQCGRGVVPAIGMPQGFEAWLHDTPPTPQGWIALPGAGLHVCHAMQTLLKSGSAPAARLIIGPEGGLDETEVALALQQGYQPVSLGPRILRTETAALAALSMLAALESLPAD